MSDYKIQSQDQYPQRFIVMLVACLLLLQGGLLAYLSWSTSPNRTEVGHLGAAVYFWHTGKFDVFHVNPPLTRFFAGAPIALFCKPNYDWKSYSPRPQDRSEWALGNAFVAANELDDLRLYVFLARIACIPLVLLGGYFGFRFATELYGQWSGIMFLILWTFSPLVLGWGATICPDVSAASLGIVGLYTFWHWLKAPSWGKAIIAGICLGFMPLTKITWIIAFPIWILLWVIYSSTYGVSATWKQFVTIIFIGVYTINSGYFYDGSFRQLKDYQFISGTLTGEKMEKGSLIKQGNRFKNSWAGMIYAPLPAEFVQGIDTQKLDFERGIESYARGVWSDHGWWWYNGYVLLLKEPLGVWALAILALAASCFFSGFNASWRDELTVLLPLLLTFVFLSSQDGFSIHPRYVIVTLPFAYIILSRMAKSIDENTLKKPLLAGATLICLIWIVGSSLWFYPHSMSHFNELAGGPKNWPKCLLGSNIDWGQDFYELKDWIAGHPEAKPLYIMVEPAIPLKKLGIECEGEIPTEPTEGWMVIGSNLLYDKDKKYDWLQEHEPVAMIGYSMWVYQVDAYKMDESAFR